MADTATLTLEEVTNNRRKKGAQRRRRALKDITTNEVNISAGKTTSGAGKEKGVAIAVALSPKGCRAATKSKAAVVPARSFADDLEELQARLDQLQLEKEKTDEMLKDRDEMLKQKEEELENRGKEQERLQKELKKLQKLKEFKPTVSLSFFQSLREKEQEKKDTKKKKKDCAEKRKPCPAYVLWCKDQWNQVKKENPSAEFKDISNILGAKWKNTSAEEKKPYEDKYQHDKEAYLQVVGQEKRENEAMKLLEEEQMQKTAMELLEQYLQFRQETETENKKTRKEKDPLKPKQPMSAFFLFTKERRAVLLEQTKNVLEISKIAGEEWKNMTEKKRAPYEEMARKQKEEYLQEMELYKQKKVEEAENVKKEEEEQKKILKQEALQMLKKKQKTDSIINILKRAPYEEMVRNQKEECLHQEMELYKQKKVEKKAKETRQNKKKQKGEKNSDPNKPKKPASSFILFSKEARSSLLKERPGVDNSTLNALVSVKWKELSETERKVWNDKAAEAMQVYKKEMEEYIKSSVASPENNTTTTSR